MNGKLLDYNNENSVEFDDLRNIQLSEKDYGLREFKILCEVHNASRNPEGRFIVELEDGRKGTVLVRPRVGNFHNLGTCILA